MKNKDYLKEIIKEVCEILNTNFEYEDEVYYISVKTENEGFEEVSIYQTIDSYGVEKIDCTVTIGPIIRNPDLIYTFLKNNFELDYGAYALIHEDDMDVLVIVESLVADTTTADDLSAIISYMAEVASETKGLITKSY